MGGGEEGKTLAKVGLVGRAVEVCYTLLFGSCLFCRSLNCCFPLGRLPCRLARYPVILMDSRLFSELCFKVIVLFIFFCILESNKEYPYSYVYY